MEDYAGRTTSHSFHFRTTGEGRRRRRKTSIDLNGTSSFRRFSTFTVATFKSDQSIDPTTKGIALIPFIFPLH